MNFWKRSVFLPMLVIAAVAPQAALAQDDPYAGMLTYLDASRIDGQALSGSSGAIAVNVAAGDANQQANVRALVVGDAATTSIHATQAQHGNLASRPTAASASIGGQALGNASGLISINQASGTANLELNSVGVGLSSQGMRQTSADQWLAGVCACTQQTTPTQAGQPASRRGLYSVAVEATAMQGATGVVQLNQIAGSGNVTANQLVLDAGLPPR